MWNEDEIVTQRQRKKSTIPGWHHIQFTTLLGLLKSNWTGASRTPHLSRTIPLRQSIIIPVFQFRLERLSNLYKELVKTGINESRDQ